MREVLPVAGLTPASCAGGMSGGGDLYASKISGNYFECRPLFVEHRSLLLCAFGSHVQAVSTHTGALIGTFSGHAGLVSAIVSANASGEAVAQDADGDRVVPDDVIVSASLDGALIVWSLVRFRVGGACLDSLMHWCRFASSFHP